jgi:hypothetical protein
MSLARPLVRFSLFVVFLWRSHSPAVQTTTVVCALELISPPRAGRCGDQGGVVRASVDRGIEGHECEASASFWESWAFRLHQRRKKHNAWQPRGDGRPSRLLPLLHS